MLNRIIKFSLENRILILVLAVLLVIAGLYSTAKTEVDVFPDLNAPTVVIMTEAGGMASEEVEQLVTFPIESAVNGSTGVRRVRSQSTHGFSVVWVEFDWGTDIYLARQIVSEKLAAIGEQMPAGVSAPVLGPQSSILGEVLIVSLTSDKTSMQDLRTYADWVIRPRLLSTGGVAQVSVHGGDIKEYQILINPGKMKHFGVSLADVMACTRGMNTNTNGGVCYKYGNEYIIRGITSTNDIDKLEASAVKKNGESVITLADVADIRVGSQSPKLGVASERAHPAVLLTVTKQPNTSTLDLTAHLDHALDELKGNLPADVHISTNIFRQADFISSSIDNVKKSLIEGAIFVVIILMIFLANVRTTIISLVTIPLSFLVAMIVLNALGISINTMTLGGLAIAIGSLVDDAIVDVENVYKHIRLNRQLPEAERVPIIRLVYEASREVRMPILNSTLIIIVSFAPLFFLSGMEGRMLIPLGIAFVTALMASTLVALTLTPVLCSYLLGKSNGEMGKEAFVAVWLKGYYQRALTWVLGHTRWVIGSTAVLLVAALATFFSLGSSFLPKFNEGSFTINISSLPGISLEESDSIGARAERLLLQVPEITTVARKTGRAELDEHALGVNVSEIEAPFKLKDRGHEEVQNDVRQRLSVLAGANIEIGQPISHRIDAMLSGKHSHQALWQRPEQDVHHRQPDQEGLQGHRRHHRPQRGTADRASGTQDSATARTAGTQRHHAARVQRVSGCQSGGRDRIAGVRGGQSVQPGGQGRQLQRDKRPDHRHAGRTQGASVRCGRHHIERRPQHHQPREHPAQDSHLCQHHRQGTERRGGRHQDCGRQQYPVARGLSYRVWWTV